MDAKILTEAAQLGTNVGNSDGNIVLLELPDMLTRWTDPDYPKTPEFGPLSGVFAGAPTTNWLLHQLDIPDETQADPDFIDFDRSTIEDAFETAYYAAYFNTLASRILAAYGLSIIPAKNRTASDVLDRLAGAFDPPQD